MRHKGDLMRKTQRFFTSLAGFLLCLFSLTTWAASSRFKPGPENQSLSQQDVRQIIEAGNFFDKYWNPSGDFANRFEEKNIHQDRVIIDRTSGLMWHPSGCRMSGYATALSFREFFALSSYIELSKVKSEQHTACSN